jgi:hypothetical protein
MYSNQAECAAIKFFVSVTNKQSSNMDERVSNASIKNYFILCALTWNNKRLLKLATDFLQHITMIII